MNNLPKHVLFVRQTKKVSGINDDVTTQAASIEAQVSIQNPTQAMGH
jgi:hypothetical protein